MYGRRSNRGPMLTRRRDENTRQVPKWGGGGGRKRRFAISFFCVVLGKEVALSRQGLDDTNNIRKEIINTLYILGFPHKAKYDACMSTLMATLPPSYVSIHTIEFSIYLFPKYSELIHS